jgi:hypothetical protein
LWMAEVGLVWELVLGPVLVLAWVLALVLG